ncbi:hypothetical protein NECAME_06267 [Necator americanus]|uniref:Uncharacterized protein n=1 Tax=Necator americanus TaxID=51031 RepID=W2TVE7_NECAM|nr:hypothetical protein NECAME_06267 [Necator americanus]ETN85753.1 hypothetical protein NECAME_06267 [Necator americanus]
MPSAASNPSTEEKTVSFKIFRDNVPRFSITYKDKKDLYESFQKKISELDFDVGSIYWVDFDGDQGVIENADDLFTASKDNPTVKLFARSDNDVISCSESDDEPARHHRRPRGRHHRRATMRGRPKNRDRTRSHSRNRMRSISRGRDRSHSRSSSRSRSRSRERHHKGPQGDLRYFGPFARMRAFEDRPPFFGPWNFPPGPPSPRGHSRRSRYRRGHFPWAYWGFPRF